MDRIVSAAQLAGMLPPRAPGIPAYQGLAESLRLLILDGRLVAGLRLPSERELSGALRLSRSTVAAAYALLRERAPADRPARGSGTTSCRRHRVGGQRAAAGADLRAGTA